MPNLAQTKEIVKKNNDLQTLQQLIEKAAKEFKKALPLHMRPERLVRIALTCIRQNPELTKTSPASFIGALLVSAQMGLEPLAGRAYILPFWNNKFNRLDAQFICGYKGLAELFYRHEKSVNLAWGIVRKNDEFEFEYGTQAKLRHKPAIIDRGEVLGYYVIAEVQGGAKPFMFMSKEDCMEHGRKHSKTFDQKTNQFYSSSPWAKEPDAMCLKTVLIQLAKLLPLSIELQRAIQADETSREYREGIDDALDIPAQDWGNGMAEGEKQPVLPPKQPQNGANGAEPDKVASEATKPVFRGSITEKQESAIKELTRKRYGDKWEEELMARVGSMGLELLCQMST
ncbi:hypothetical protein FJZ33_00005, partial [Candidatus Poribacteria bacterium]|nr:hypothetical protein [Candidatus Poribacteria bacterium]